MSLLQHPLLSFSTSVQHAISEPTPELRSSRFLIFESSAIEASFARTYLDERSIAAFRRRFQLHAIFVIAFVLLCGSTFAQNPFGVHWYQIFFVIALPPGKWIALAPTDPIIHDSDVHPSVLCHVPYHKSWVASLWRRISSA